MWLSLHEIVRRLVNARDLAVACDFDGTLAPIAEHPAAVVLDERARAALESLVRAPRTQVAVLSGRSLPDLEARLGVAGIHLAGAAGLETRDLAGRRENHVPPGRGLPPDLAPRLEGWCRGFRGAWVETKGPSLAVHYRALAPRREGEFVRGLRRMLRTWAGATRVTPGRKVFEVAPTVDHDKGAALEDWLRGLPGPLVFYFGDDAVDEPVHEAVRRRGGVSVAIGLRTSRAEFALPDPLQVVWFLEWLAHEWQKVALPG
ncbi:MAG TPA: trehalose-phosphatase [Terriglobales bacterium]|nr:trehalose-phosphatase [Terriglobales bacterium]